MAWSVIMAFPVAFPGHANSIFLHFNDATGVQIFEFIEMCPSVLFLDSSVSPINGNSSCRN